MLAPTGKAQESSRQVQREQECAGTGTALGDPVSAPSCREHQREVTLPVTPTCQPGSPRDAGKSWGWTRLEGTAQCGDSLMCQLGYPRGPGKSWGWGWLGRVALDGDSRKVKEFQSEQGLAQTTSPRWSWAALIAAVALAGNSAGINTEWGKASPATPELLSRGHGSAPSPDTG